MLYNFSCIKLGMVIVCGVIFDKTPFYADYVFLSEHYPYSIVSYMNNFLVHLKISTTVFFFHIQETWEKVAGANVRQQTPWTLHCSMLRLCSNSHV